jgi:hypothetical protein
VFSDPLTSSEIEVEIVIADKKDHRPDVDNIPKRVLDALNGIAYIDDRQVVHSSVTLIPIDDNLRSINGLPHRTLTRLIDGDEFLIRIRERLITTIGQAVPSS